MATSRYTGIERLCYQFATELASIGHDVSLLAYKDSLIPNGVKLLPCDEQNDPSKPLMAEQKAFQKWQYLFRSFDVIHDWGHLHLIARIMPNMPVGSMLNNAPEHSKYDRAPYNIISWSQWGVRTFKRFYSRTARYQESVVIDPEVYKPSGKRGDRFLTIGRMSSNKGNLNAALLCKSLGLPLDVCGGRGAETTEKTPEREYEKTVKELCDESIVFRGEVTDEEKIQLMQSCRALIYMTNHTEITSHKVQEALFCGAPVIIPNRGGLPEIITEGVDGFLCNTESEYIEAIKNVDKLQPEKTHAAIVAKYNIHNVVRDYVKLYGEIANGVRW